MGADGLQMLSCCGFSLQANLGSRLLQAPGLCTASWCQPTIQDSSCHLPCCTICTKQGMDWAMVMTKMTICSPSSLGNEVVVYADDGRGQSWPRAYCLGSTLLQQALHAVALVCSVLDDLKTENLTGNHLFGKLWQSIPATRSGNRKCRPASPSPLAIILWVRCQSSGHSPAITCLKHVVGHQLWQPLWLHCRSRGSLPH